MKRLRHTLVIWGVAAVTLGVTRTSVFADTFDDGMRAYLAMDYVRAMACWRPLAESADDGDAQYGVAQLFEHGDGVAVNIRTASVWYLRAANQGHTHAQLALASLYETGRGVPRNARFAEDWYTKAAEAGNPQAQFGLARMILRGEVEERDAAVAHVWLARAAAQGYRRAIDDLARRNPQEKTEPAPPLRAEVSETAAKDEVRVEPAQRAPPPAGITLRLGSHATRDAAEAAWQDLSERFPSELGQLRPYYGALTVGDTEFVRLDAGPVEDEAAALDACARLRAGKQYCFPLLR